MRDRVPHLALRTGEAIGVVGPLVRPGRSACLRCVDLRKADGRPAWPKVLAQATFARARPQACDTVLAAMTATLASAQALAYIDRAGHGPGRGERDARGGPARLAVAAPDLAAAPGLTCGVAAHAVGVRALGTADGQRPRLAVRDNDQV